MKSGAAHSAAGATSQGQAAHHTDASMQCTLLQRRGVHPCPSLSACVEAVYAHNTLKRLFALHLCARGEFYMPGPEIGMCLQRCVCVCVGGAGMCMQRC